MNAIILHGCPEKEDYYNPNLPSESNAHWLPWLQKELLLKDISAITPEIPHAFEPNWDLWKREVERFEIGPDTMLIGHSCGGGFWVRYLSEYPQLRVNKVVLVAPWLDPDKTIDPSFFDFEPDPSIVSRTAELTIFWASDDSKSVLQSVNSLRIKLPNAKFREFPGYGHFTYHNLGGEHFDELRGELLNSQC